MGLFNFFKKRDPNPALLFQKMYPKGNGKELIYESFKKVAETMTKKMSKEDALAFYMLCSMKFELFKKNEKTINHLIHLILKEKGDTFNHKEADEIARQIYIDAMSRFIGVSPL